MSERPIQVGDLVVVILPKPCCGYAEGVGRIDTVVEDSDRRPLVQCAFCGALNEHSSLTTVRLKDGYIFRYRLKRILPISELEGKRTEESLRQPTKEDFHRMVDKMQETLRSMK